MNPRNPATYPAQRQHGNHSSNCGCFSGNHIWDEEYDGRGKEGWCVCCDHFYNIDDNAEFEAIENSIVMDETISNKKPGSKPEEKQKAFSKGKIVRRV